MNGISRALVDPGVRERKYSRRMLGMRREKLSVYLRCPYRKPTQVGRKRILRPTGEELLRNSAN